MTARSTSITSRSRRIVGAETRSNLLLKVAVRDRARSVYGGMIDVAPTAVHADGYVANRNLLLSQGAKADSIPRLEIRANDVKCGHGATAGHIDSDQRFYLMARGVPPEEASSLIVRGFMDDVLDRVPHRGFAELAGALLDAEIAGGSVAGVAAEADERRLGRRGPSQRHPAGMRRPRRDRRNPGGDLQRRRDLLCAR